MNRFEKSICVFAVTFVVGFRLLSHWDMERFSALVQEDGVVEWLTVLALCCGALLSLYRLVTLKSHKPPLFLAGLCLFVALFTFGAGEEISWGQRLFDRESPEFFGEHNDQHETNLHNLKVGDIKLNKLIFSTGLGVVMCFYLLVFPALYKKYSFWTNLADRTAVPVPRGYHVLLLLAVVVLVHVGLESSKKGELMEFGGCWLFFAITLNPLNVDQFRQPSGPRED